MMIGRKRRYLLSPRYEVWQPLRRMADRISKRLRQKHVHCGNCGLFAMTAFGSQRWTCPRCANGYVWLTVQKKWQRLLPKIVEAAK